MQVKRDQLLSMCISGTMLIVYIYIFFFLRGGGEGHKKDDQFNIFWDGANEALL